MSESAPPKEKRPKAKRQNLTIRISSEMRNHLEVAAETSRSISEVAEAWLEAAHAGRAGYAARLGGSQVVDAIEAMIDFAAQVQREVGDPRSFLPARDALQAGWRLLIDRALPYTPDAPEGEDYRERRRVLLEHCEQIRNQIRTAFYDAEGTFIAPVAPDQRPENSLSADISSLGRLLFEAVEAHEMRGNDGFFRNLQRQATAVGDRARSDAPQLASDLAALQSIISAFQKADRAYMTPRRQAADRGRALADSLIAPKPLPL